MALRTGYAAAVFFTLMTWPLPGADGRAALEQQLRTNYPLVQMASDSLSVAQAGTVLTVNKPNIGTLPGTAAVPFMNTYRDGQIKRANLSKIGSGLGGLGSGLGGLTAGRITKPQASPDLPVGGKVYLIKLEVRPDGKEASIVFTVQTCEACDFTPMSAFTRSAVTFVFPKGSFDSPDIAKIGQTIGEVFTAQATAAPQVSDAGQQPAADPAQAAAQQIPQQQPQPLPQAAPASIELGQSPDQVLAVLGAPDRKASVGPKEIYFYKDMKITFQNGKVIDVQ